MRFMLCRGGVFMQKLRKKMIWIVFFSTVVVFVLLAVMLYFSLTIHNARQADGMTLIISLNNGDVPLYTEYKQRNFQNKTDYHIAFDEESVFKTRYFVVDFDAAGQPVRADVDHVAVVDEDMAKQMAAAVLARKRTVGYEKKYRYRVVMQENGGQVIFLNCKENDSNLRTILSIVCLVSVVFVVMITLIFSFCSSLALRPFEENSRRQKQFVTNASHELKTPLAIISANAEVLQYKNGGDEWTKNIVDQTKHMGSLINQLLTLSKMEEFSESLIMENLDFSTLVRETVDNFQEVADRRQVSLELDVTQGIEFNGNREQLTQVVSILTENAAKYVTEGGTIRVSLSRSGRYAVLKIFNTADMAKNADLSRLFERFYRSDSSRSSETGGHGIGLSIAKKIVNAHNGSIEAKQVQDGICFTAMIACNLKTKAAALKKA